MELERYKILGLVERIGKTGAIWTTLYLEGEFDAYAKDNSERCEGKKVLIESTGYKLPIVHPGDVVNIFYVKGYEDKAVLSGLCVVETSVQVKHNENAKK